MVKNDSFDFEVVENYGQIAEKGGYSLELRKVSWNGREAKFDIRPWKDDKCGKGITLTDDEMKGLFDLLVDLDKKGLFKD